MNRCVVFQDAASDRASIDVRLRDANDRRWLAGSAPALPATGATTTATTDGQPVGSAYWNERGRRVGGAGQRCCACSTTPGSERDTVRSTAFNPSKASQPTLGTAITRNRQHAAGSNIQVGISTDRRVRSSSRPHRHTECPYLTSTSYTATERPNHGCHG